MMRKCEWIPNNGPAYAWMSGIFDLEDNIKSMPDKYDTPAVLTLINQMGVNLGIRKTGRRISLGKAVKILERMKSIPKTDRHAFQDDEEYHRTLECLDYLNDVSAGIPVVSPVRYPLLGGTRKIVDEAIRTIESYGDETIPPIIVDRLKEAIDVTHVCRVAEGGNKCYLRLLNETGDKIGGIEPYHVRDYVEFQLKNLVLDSHVLRQAARHDHLAATGTDIYDTWDMIFNNIEKCVAARRLLSEVTDGLLQLALYQFGLHHIGFYKLLGCRDSKTMVKALRSRLYVLRFMDDELDEAYRVNDVVMRILLQGTLFSAPSASPESFVGGNIMILENPAGE